MRMAADQTGWSGHATDAIILIGAKHRQSMRYFSGVCDRYINTLLIADLICAIKALLNASLTGIHAEVDQ